MPCNPQNIPQDPSCINQTIALDCSTGDLSISNGNVINLACAINLLETKTEILSLALIGSFLVLVYLGEDGIQQTNTVDLAPLITTFTQISTIDSNSIDLTIGSNVLRADLKIDPASTIPISASVAGVKFDKFAETPIAANSTNTIQLAAGGNIGHTLTANLKYQSSQSINLSDSSNGLLAEVKYSTDANNTAFAGTDGALYVQSASAQLLSLPTNGFVTTGTTGTLLVGSDSKTYRIPDALGETPITGVNSNTANITVNGPGNHTIKVDVNITNSNGVILTNTASGIQADVRIDTTPGNVVITESATGIKASFDDDSVLGVQNSVATVQNPITKVYGYLNNNNGGYATTFISQYGVKTPSFTTTQRLAIPIGDLYDTLFIFDSTLRKFVWYDAVTSSWIQIG